MAVIIATAPGVQGPESSWQSRFAADKSELSATGRNQFFILETGRQLELRGGGTRLLITVTRETELVDGVRCRVVEEREWEDGRLIEVSRNFFAIHPRTRDVYYFGEDVDMYHGGKIVSHDGAWRSGRNGARFGLMMPGAPRKGQAFYQEVAPKVAMDQEVAPKVAMDRARLVATNFTVATPAGRFAKCLRFEETTPLEPKAREFKVYAPGIGLVQDADLKLTKRVAPGDHGSNIPRVPPPGTLHR
jgi:hypothetical protein